MASSSCLGPLASVHLYSLFVASIALLSASRGIFKGEDRDIVLCLKAAVKAHMCAWDRQAFESETLSTYFQSCSVPVSQYGHAVRKTAKETRRETIMALTVATRNISIKGDNITEMTRRARRGLPRRVHRRRVWPVFLEASPRRGPFSERDILIRCSNGADSVDDAS
ncbi:hypothetical protein Goshw_026309, partial [Gossypium schwendimanii]|nr:hypothetical protein [Gossypium schwendimanii]